VYLLKNKKGEDIGVFKPMDEEYVPEDAEKWALVKGHGSYRERAAFLVSNELGGYGGVPTTIITTIKHPTFQGGEKRGSLQRFVPASTDMSDLGPAGIDVEQVHKIAIVDLLLFNVDRHEGNVLLRVTNGSSNEPTRELVPIDHGLCLPVIVTREHGPNRQLMTDLYFAWQTWPQAQQPFGPKASRFLGKLSPHMVDDLVRVLRTDLGNQAIPSPALTTLKVGALLLRTCALAGLSLSAMASFVRELLSDVLEEAWLEADAEGGGMRDTHGNEIVTPGPVPVVNVPVVSGPVVVREGMSGSDARFDVEERMYATWEARLLKALEVRLKMALEHPAAAAAAAAAAV